MGVVGEDESLLSREYALAPSKLSTHVAEELFGRADQLDYPLRIDWRDPKQPKQWTHFELKFPEANLALPVGAVHVEWENHISRLEQLLPDLFPDHPNNRGVLKIAEGSNVLLRYFTTLNELRIRPEGFSTPEEALQHILALMDKIAPALKIDYFPSEIIAKNGIQIADATIERDKLFKIGERELQRVAYEALRAGGYSALNKILLPRFNQLLQKLKSGVATLEHRYQHDYTIHGIERETRTSTQIYIDSYIYHKFFNLPCRGSFTSWKEKKVGEKLAVHLKTTWREMLRQRINKISKKDLTEPQLKESYNELLANHDPLLRPLLLLYAMSDENDFGLKKLVDAKF